MNDVVNTFNPFSGSGGGIGGLLNPISGGGGIFSQLFGDIQSQQQPTAQPAPAQPAVNEEILTPGTASEQRRGNVPTAPAFSEEREENRRRRRAARRTGGAVTLLTDESGGPGLGG